MIEMDAPPAVAPLPPLSPGMRRTSLLQNELPCGAAKFSLNFVPRRRRSPLEIFGRGSAPLVFLFNIFSLGEGVKASANVCSPSSFSR